MHDRVQRLWLDKILTSAMFIGKDNSKPLGPAWTMVAGIVLLLAAVGLFCVFVVGLKTGETMKFSKMHPGLATRQDDPGHFWFSEIFSLIIGFMLASVGVRILRDAFRQLRR